MRSLSDLVPGGCATYSKGDYCFPSNAPRYLVKGEGCYVWDSKGNMFLDWGMNLRSVILGYTYDKVDSAVRDAISKGIGFTRPGILELQLAELLHEKILCAEMVKFGKAGSDATSAAVRLARAYTGRDLVLRASENPFISQHDWFIGSTVLNDGIPTDPNVMQYSYNDFNTFDQFDLQKVAAIVLDPSTVDITKGNLQYLRALCDKHGIVFILDEIISGIRYGVGGVQGLLGVTPDLATFGKGMGNGFSISALCGKRDIMKLGDRDYGDVFLLSGTYNAETTGIAAAIATIHEISQNGLILQQINSIGRILVEGIKGKIRKYGLDEHIGIKHVLEGRMPSMSFSSMEVKTIFDQHMIECKILMPYIAPCFAHTEWEVVQTLDAVEHSLFITREMIAKALESEHDLATFCFDCHVEKPVFKKGEAQ